MAELCKFWKTKKCAMIKSIFILLFILTFCVRADNLTCQYQESAITGYERVSSLYVDGAYQEKPVEVTNFRGAYINGPTGYGPYEAIEVKNNLDVLIAVTVQFASKGSGTANSRLSIPSHDFAATDYFQGIDHDSIKFVYENNSYGEARWDDFPITVTQCKKCPNNTETDCINDGDPCTADIYCGAGYCVNGRCSNTMTCYNNDCKCADDEIQCPNNAECAKKDSKDIGSMPECGFVDECKSETYCSPITQNLCITRKYLGPNNGTCQEHPDITAQKAIDNSLIAAKRQAELEAKKIRLETENTTKTVDLIIVLVLLVATLTGGIVLVLKVREKSEKEIERAKQRSIQEHKEAQIKIENAKKGAEQKQIEWEKNERWKELDRIKTLRNRIQSENNDLKILHNNLKIQRNKIQSENDEIERQNDKRKQLDKEAEELRRKPRLIGKPIGGYYWINESKGGYPCFYRKGTLNPHSNDLIHIAIYEKETQETIKQNEEIHHIDSDPMHWNIENLIKLTKEQHQKILKHSRITQGDYILGVKELRRIGINDSLLPPRVKEHEKRELDKKRTQKKLDE